LPRGRFRETSCNLAKRHVEVLEPEKVLEQKGFDIGGGLKMATIKKLVIIDGEFASGNEIVLNKGKDGRFRIGDMIVAFVYEEKMFLSLRWLEHALSLEGRKDFDWEDMEQTALEDDVL
jgi:hypothetical protein